MPKKAKATKPATKTSETKPEAPRGAKTAAIKQALKANPKKTAREIAELVKEQGFETSANYVATIKTKMKGKKKAKAAPAPTPRSRRSRRPQRRHLSRLARKGQGAGEAVGWGEGGEAGD